MGGAARLCASAWSSLLWTGRANDAVLRTLATALGLPQRAHTLMLGEHRREKVILIDVPARAEVEARLAAAAPVDRGPD